MINVYYSNKLEKLAEFVAQKIKSSRKSIFEKDLIIVQTDGMSKWLTLKCAEINGAVSGLEFTSPVKYCIDLMTESLDRKYNIPDKHALTWIIYKFFNSDDSNTLEYAPVSSYHGDDSLKMFQLAARCADLFDQYSLYRPDMAVQWDSGNDLFCGEEKLPDEFKWQYHLWRRVFSEFDHRSRLLDDFIKLGKPLVKRKIYLFGITALPDYVIKVYAKAAEFCEIDMYVMNPSPEFWQDVRSKDAVLYHSLRNGSDGYYEEKNPLLASYGKLSREFFEILYDNCAESGNFNEDDSVFEEPSTESVLSSIQYDIFSLSCGNTANSADKRDSSVLVHVCHSPLREVEVLYDYVLDAIENGIKPENIVVMVPDISGYAPFIEAVFSSPENEAMRLPFTISDRKPSSESGFINAFYNALNFPDNRYSLSAFSGILKSDPVRKKYSINSQAADTAVKWLYDSGTRWGLSGKQRSEDYGIDYSEFSWHDSLKRIIIGYGFGETENKIGEYIPYSEIEGNSADTFASVLKLFRKLEKFSGAMKQKRSVSDWNGLVSKFIDDVFDYEDYYRDYSYIKKVMKQIENSANIAEYAAKIDFNVYRYEITRLIDFEMNQRGFISGGITFCQLLPLRSIPFDYIAVLGLNAGEFPRSSNNLGFDLINYKRRKGDRSAKNDDRGLFLESILSARVKLHLSYTGRDAKTNEQIPPSGILDEFINYLKEYYPNHDFLRQHALKGFSEKYYDGKDNRYFSYFSNRIIRSSARDIERPDFTTNASCLLNESVVNITPEMFAEFFCDPMRYYFEKKCGIRYEKISSADYDSEPLFFTISDKKDYGRKIESYIKKGYGYSEIKRILSESMMMPAGHYSEAAFEIITEEYGNIFNYISNNLNGYINDRIAIDIAILKLSINGLCEIYRGKDESRAVFMSYSRDSVYYETKAWIYNIMLSLVSDVKTVLVKKDNTDYEVPSIHRSSAGELIKSLAEVYMDYLDNPYYIVPAAVKSKWVDDEDEFIRAYYSEIGKTPDSFRMDKTIVYADYSKISRIHFADDLKKVYNYASVLWKNYNKAV